MLNVSIPVTHSKVVNKSDLMAFSPFQATLKQPVSCIGVGVHSGKPVTLTLTPAPSDTGIVFIRTDIDPSRNQIPAKWNTVVDTMMCTKIANVYGTSISTIEHVVAALAGASIDNCFVEVNGPEVPIMDGSSAAFSKMIQSVGIQTFVNPATVIEILKPIKVTHGGASAEFIPDDHFSITMDFDAHGRFKELQDYTGSSSFSFDPDYDDFSELLASARTFGFFEDAEKLWAAGLAKGASLENTIVIRDGNVMNQDGLRYSNEFVRHKILDAIGDFALAGVRLKAKFHGINSGHALNNQLLRVLFATPDAWRLVQGNAESLSILDHTLAN